jgi:hypothetical protein
MALLLHAKGRAYPQSAPASKPEAQEVRSKENPDWKNPGEEKKKIYWLVLQPLHKACCVSVENGMVFLRRSQPNTRSTTSTVPCDDAGDVPLG